jgi:hypothetical protein
VLDSLDIQAVVGKNFSGKNADRDVTAKEPKNRSIAGAEPLRIYLNRALPAIQTCVRFWFYKLPRCPPWETYYTLDGSQPNGQEVVANAGAGLWANYNSQHVDQIFRYRVT